MSEMTCREFFELLSDYLDDEMAPEARVVFERHIELCPPCVDYLESFRRCRQLAVSSCQHDHDDVPADVPDGLVKAILAARKGQST